MIYMYYFCIEFMKNNLNISILVGFYGKLHENGKGQELLCLNYPLLLQYGYIYKY